MKIAAKRIKEYFQEKKKFDFPPKLADLIQFSRRSDSPSCLETFLHHLVGDTTNRKYSSSIPFISEVLESLATKNRTQLPIML